jgi:hypothetical protein
MTLKAYLKKLGNKQVSFKSLVILVLVGFVCTQLWLSSIELVFKLLGFIVAASAVTLSVVSDSHVQSKKEPL